MQPYVCQMPTNWYWEAIQKRPRANLKKKTTKIKKRSTTFAIAKIEET